MESIGLYAITSIISLLSGGGIALWLTKSTIRNEARTEITPDIEKLHKRINIIEKDYVTCKYCTMQHANLDRHFDNINSQFSLLNKRFDSLETLLRGN